MNFNECNKCPLLVKSRNSVVTGRGSNSAKIIFIGEAPSQNGSNKTLVPFLGDKSGFILRRLIEKYGINQYGLFFTNLVRCSPPKNRAPTKIEISNCFSNLQQEINTIKPKIIVTLGRLATQQFLGKDIKINQIQGKLIKHLGIWIFPLYHPAYVVRGGITKHEYSQSFSRLGMLIKNI